MGLAVAVNKYKVILAHMEHPTWTAPEIARHVGCNQKFVRDVAAREQLAVPRGKPGFKAGSAKCKT